MQVKDVMTPKVDLVSPTTTLLEASRMMRQDDVGSLAVGQDDRLVGMITDRDIVVRGIADGGDPKTASVGDVMSSEILYCFEDQSVDEVCTNMGANQVRRLPVIDREKRMVGIVSLGDLAAKGSPSTAGEALESISRS